MIVDETAVLRREDPPVRSDQKFGGQAHMCLSTAESAAQARHSRQRPVGRTPGARMEGVPGRHPAHLELAVEFELRIRYCGEWKRTLELQHRLAPRMEDNDLTDACSHDLRVAARYGSKMKIADWASSIPSELQMG